MDAAHARPVRGRVRHPVHCLRHRADQHLGHGVRHGAHGQRDAGADGHAGQRRARTSRQQRSRRRRRRQKLHDRRRPRPMRKTPPNAHRVSIPRAIDEIRGVHRFTQHFLFDEQR